MIELPESGASAPASFAQWLRPKRRVYQWLVIACALMALSTPLVMQWVEFELSASGGWEAVDAVAQLKARFGLPWWLLAWLFPLAYAAAVAAALLVFEAIFYFLRVDRGDHAWSSMCWALRGWKAALLWMLASVAAFMATTALMDWLLQSEDWLGALGIFLALALQLLIWNAGYLAAPKPLVRVRPRWPGALAFVLALAWYLAVFLAGQGPSSHQSLTLSGALLAAAVLSIVGLAYLAVEILWLNGGRSGVGAIRDAIRPRVFLPMLVLQLRWFAWLPLLLLLLLPLCLLLIGVVPLLAQQLAECCMQDKLPTLVAASRFAVAWWWMIALILIGLGIALPLTWFGTASSGRLLLELGVVRGEAPRAES